MVKQFLHNIRGLNEKLLLNQYKLARGVNYSKPSDGPLEVGHILSYKTQEKKFEQLQKNIANGLSHVDYMDTLLQTMVTRISEVRTDIIQGSNETMGSSDRQALALEIDQLLNAMLEDSQSRFRGIYLFSGFETLTNPFYGSFSRWDQFLGSVDYLGDAGRISRRIQELSRLPINIYGKSLFMEQTYTLKGKYLPADEPLGFTGTLTINRENIVVNADDTLNDIRDMINANSNLKVIASTDNGYLQLESTTSSEEIRISDDQDGVLLDHLGLNLRGAWNRGITGPTMPVIDSTGAIFDGAGPVTNLTYDSTNNILNLHLGPNANDGLAESHSITIPEGTYADVDELVAAIQTQINDAFGRDKILVENNAGTLRISTVATGASIGMADLQVGGEIDGVWDSASDAADLNLIAAPDPAPQTMAGTAGTDGTDKFYIDIGELISRDGQDTEAVEIDLRAANTGTLAEMIDEINYQINQDLSLRGLVRAREDNGRILIETIKTGHEITADQLHLSDSTAGTLAGLGILEDPTQAYIDGIPPAAYPVNIVAGVNDTIEIDLGPSVSRSGVNYDPITITLDEGSYATINDLVNEINIQIHRTPEFLGSIVAQVEGLPGSEYIRIASVDDGSDVEGIDLQITAGTALADLGLAIGQAVSGGGTSEGKSTELEPQNIFNTLIEIRDSLLNYATGETLIKEIQADDGGIIEIFEGDQITLEEGGRSFTFTFRATDTIDDLVRMFDEFLGGKAEARFDRSGRLVIDNLTTTKITGIKISAQSADGIERTAFNDLFQTENEVLGLSSISTQTIKDPVRHNELSDRYLGVIDIDMDNFFKHQAFVGATANRLERTSTLIVDMDFNVKEQRANVESANMADVIMELSQQEALLEAALNVGSRVLMTSLLDYLR